MTFIKQTLPKWYTSFMRWVHAAVNCTICLADRYHFHIIIDRYFKTSNRSSVLPVLKQEYVKWKLYQAHTYGPGRTLRYFWKGFTEAAFSQTSVAPLLIVADLWKLLSTGGARHSLSPTWVGERQQSAARNIATHSKVTNRLAGSQLFSREKEGRGVGVSRTSDVPILSGL